jgi:hypothetical protein
MMRANTKPHTGSSVSHTSIAITPNANVITGRGIRTQVHLRLMIDVHTEDDEIPPIGDLLVNGHQTSMDIRLLRERAARLTPDMLALVQKSVHNESSHRRECETVKHDNGYGHEERAVSLVCL